MSTSATESKLRSLEEAAETIADGSTIAIGGLSMNAPRWRSCAPSPAARCAT